MCGRYSALTEEEIIEIREVIREVSLRIGLDSLAADDAKTEVFPTDNAPIITSGAEGVVSFENLRWGFKKWDGKGVIINARVETVATKGMFAPHLAAGRCVVPAGEYYEWETKGKQKTKHYIKDAAGNLLFMAGLYREAEFVILTKGAEGDVTHLHDRMPVLLRADQIEAWLCGQLTPEEITRGEFNAEVVPCEAEFSQMSL